ncbi:hypothetical protein C8R44DRAFT_973862 [Mycena epipterygia]|nr:hypothetical protein C8R44DRAFT_973862 [Mycena epipterygia]
MYASHVCTSCTKPRTPGPSVAIPITGLRRLVIWSRINRDPRASLTRLPPRPPHPLVVHLIGHPTAPHCAPQCITNPQRRRLAPPPVIPARHAIAPITAAANLRPCCRSAPHSAPVHRVPHPNVHPNARCPQPPIPTVAPPIPAVSV